MKDKTILFKYKYAGYIRFFVLLLLAIITIIPFLVMISASFKPEDQVLLTMLEIIPKNFTFENYRMVIEHQFYFTWYANTIKIVVLVIGFRLLIITAAAYAFARLDFPFKEWIFIGFLMSMMVPNDITLIPRFLLYKQVGLLDTHWAIILQDIFDVFFLFLLRQFFRGIPKELTEAAIIDGCSHFRVYYQIVLPLAKPALVTMILFSFIWVWNSFVDPFIFLSKMETQMLAPGLRFFQAEAGDEGIPLIGMQLAGASLAVIPTVILFMVTQRWFIRGIASTGIKG